LDQTTSGKDYNAILDYDSYSPAIYVRSTGVLQFYPHPSSTAAFFNDGQFHHFAVVRSSGQVTYYKDGVAAGDCRGRHADECARTSYIGRDPCRRRRFVGLIDELTFYNRALASNEVQRIYAQSSGGKCGPSSTRRRRRTSWRITDFKTRSPVPSALRPFAIPSTSGNAFVTAAVDGSPRTVLGFPTGSGLSLAPTTGLAASNNFSVVMLMRFDSVSGYPKAARHVCWLGRGPLHPG
jgi:hypothetical protein